jgi:integrase
MDAERFPTPGKRARMRGGRRYWVIYWREKSSTKEIGIGYVSEVDAETARQTIALALRGACEWPPWASKAAPRTGPEVDHSDLEATLAQYREHLKANCTPLWAATSAHYVRLWLDHAAPGEATVRDAQAFLDGFSGKAAGTRNHIRNCCGRFQKWLGKTNVFREIRKAKVADPEEGIQYFTREERDAILAAMADNERAIAALWIAFFAGLRREEIARLDWSDIDFPSNRITIRKSKTSRRRVLPLSGKLAEFLLPRKKKSGHIVPWNHGAEGTDWKSIARDVTTNVCRAIPHLEDRASWNTFRHTFASLLVQPPARVSIDTISAWLGNSPEVCRRHYAQFVPRDAKDSAIDSL